MTSLQQYIELPFLDFSYIKNAWIGGLDSREEETWVWQGSGRNIEFQIWSPYSHQPDNNNGNEHCLMMAGPSSSNHVTGLWHDKRCHLNYRHICEFNYWRMAMWLWQRIKLFIFCLLYLHVCIFFCSKHRFRMLTFNIF